MPTDEELQAAVTAAIEKTKAEAKAETEKAIEAARSGKFTQEDLDRIAGESRKDGRASAEKELLKGLGVENLDAVKAVIEAAKKAEEDQKTELQKAQDEAARAREEAEAAKAVARNSRIESALDIALRTEGLNPERAVAAKRLVDTSKLVVEGSEVSGLDDAVKELKAQSPEWFGPRVSPPDASGRGSGPIDFKTASPEDRDKALEAYGVRL